MQLQDLTGAVSQRDQVINKLSSSLEEARESRENLQAEYMRQAEQLTQQVSSLQTHLTEVGTLSLGGNLMAPHGGRHTVTRR